MPCGRTQNNMTQQWLCGAVLQQVLDALRLLTSPNRKLPQ